MSKTNLMHRVSFKHLSKLLNSPNIVEVGPTMLFESREEFDKAYPMFEKIVNELNNLLADELPPEHSLEISLVDFYYGNEIEISYRIGERENITLNFREKVICELVRNVLKVLFIELKEQRSDRLLSFDLFVDEYIDKPISSYKNEKDIARLGLYRYREYKFSEPLINDEGVILSYYSRLGLSVNEQDVKLDFSK